MKILSFGAGMQSTALALMSCENAIAQAQGDSLPHTLVPVYDLVVFCDLGLEPPWVMKQVEFTRRACEKAAVPFKVIVSPLYEDFMANFGERRTVSIPWWTLREDGHKAKMPRNCTIDYKIETISKYVRWKVLGYKRGQRLRPEDHKTHEMHMGFSYEEKHRCKESTNPMFVNCFPLVEMKLVRADNYAYIRDVWGLETKASACTFCPFHRNYFFQHLKECMPREYARLLAVDNLLRDKTPKPPMDSDLFISRSRKRIADLTPEECNDAECFLYRGQQIWNGFERECDRAVCETRTDYGGKYLKIRKAIHEAGFDDFCQAGSVNRFHKMNIVAESAVLGKRFWFCVDGGYGVKDELHIAIRDLRSDMPSDEWVSCKTQEEMAGKIKEIRGQIETAKIVRRNQHDQN